ncbi:hypothetical protein TVAG_269320 [Trichomonas vaginalis G3]|uniref:WW domain-containing protein n=1 Tax=Trichomonas vaginalis (strain ATCC PRA-98 / G3) TaxID=412133 RepID=A2EG45_TRIV3|nr:RH04127P family [Trichomonas vaginalis G3]EAY08406.1 hypothetical protein TVAG_269320 [Trichomonas vaginalis G3]KAI5499311.1 RH04127P family [Trichomonas vaginalis G3]|eukprot:XP_001320629.1 hypothetical protein [Trichomonas vaginalis G3]
MENYQEIAYEPPENPTDEEIAEYCQYLGLDPQKDPDLLWIAIEGIKAPLPDGWIFFQHKHKNESFFYNKYTGVSINEHPLDSHYLQNFKEEKKKKYQNSKSKKSPNTRQEKSMIVPPKSDNLYNESPQNKTTNQIQKPKYSVSDEIISDDDLDTELQNFDINVDSDDKIKSTSLSKISKLNLSPAIDSREDAKNENKEEKKDEQEEIKVSSLQNQSLDENKADDEYQSVKSDCEQKIKEIKIKSQKQIKELLDKCENEKKKIENDHANAMIKLKQKNQNEIDEFMKQHKKTIENMRRAHEEKIKAIKEKAAAHLQEVSNEIQNPQPDKAENTIEAEKKKQDQRLINLRAQYEKDFAAQQKENQNKLQALKSECDIEIKRYKRQLHLDKQKIFAAARKDAQNRAVKECISSCNIDTFKVISFKPRPDRLKGILKRSAPFALNLVDDEYYGDLSISPNTIVFTRSSTIKSSGSSDSFTEIEPFKDRKGGQIRGNFLSESSIDSSDSEPIISPSSKAASKMKREAIKTSERFSSSAEKAVMAIGNAFSEIEGKSNQLRTFCAEENRGMSKLTMEFQQKAFEISKMFHETLIVLEDAHRAAMNSATQPREIYTQPVQNIQTPPPIRTRSSGRRRVEYDDYDSDDNGKESVAQRMMKLYQREQHSARSASKRLKRKFAEILVDSDQYSN